MSLISFIDKKTFEVKDELEDYIYCDYEIRNIIAKLNKKGYITAYSCAGHNEVGLFWLTHRDEIKDLDDYLNESKTDNALHFIKKDDKYFYHKDEKTSTYIYISFANKYDFNSYPKGYDYEIFNNNSYISKEIEFYKDTNHLDRKTDKEIFEELDNAHITLENWVDTLPTII